MEDSLGGDDRTVSDVETDQILSLCPEVFGRVMLNESQTVKNVNSVVHQSVAKLNAELINLVTATLMINKVEDRIGQVMFEDYVHWFQV